MLEILEIKESIYDSSVLNVLSLCQYQPTKERMLIIADRYSRDESVHVYASFSGTAVAGVLALKKLESSSIFEIIGVAVSPEHRNAGVASSLLEYAISELKCTHIFAETDDDAVGFYRSFGFYIDKLGEKYEGVVRYICTIDL